MHTCSKAHSAGKQAYAQCEGGGLWCSHGHWAASRSLWCAQQLTGTAYFANVRALVLKPMLALQKFPREYTDAIKQAQNSTAAALAAGLRLLEIEFPTSSLASVSGAFVLTQMLALHHREACSVLV